MSKPLTLQTSSASAPGTQLRTRRPSPSPFYNEAIARAATAGSTEVMNRPISPSTGLLGTSPSTAQGVTVTPPKNSVERKSTSVPERNASTMNMDLLRSSVRLLDSALKERNKQLEIQSKEGEFLRKELRRKDEVIKEYEGMNKEFEHMQKKQFELLQGEIKILRMDVMSKTLTIREQENTIEQCENKIEKLLSVMPPPSLPRARAQGVSAEPKTFSTATFRRISKPDR